jgi:hypothetical protein
MIESEAIAQVNEILGRRREYYAWFEDTGLAADVAFTDVDYTFAWYLITRLGITSICADVEQTGAMFRNDALKVSVTGDGSAPAADSVGPLYLCSPSNHPSASWLESAKNTGAIVLCYGLSATLGIELAEMIALLSASEDQPIFVPLFGSAPGLWRAASMLVGHRTQRAKFVEIAQNFTAAFLGDDLDPLRLAEENLTLRSKIQRLTTPGSNEAEIARLRSEVAALETLVASLRRGAMQQEKTIAALKKSRGEPVPTSANGHVIASGR